MIPKQLMQQEFRFCLIRRQSKSPFEKEWQKKGYRWSDPKLLKHLRNGGNYGVIGGYGNLRILDIDDKTKIEQFKKEFENTFLVETGGGGLHLYFISEYNTNHVLKNGLGEFRANNYQCVGAGSTHPNGEIYKPLNDNPIVELDKENMEALLKPYLKEQLPTTEIKDKPTDKSRSGLEYRKVLVLLREGKTREQIFKQMLAYSKWKEAPKQYREMTYEKAKKLTETEDKTKSFLMEDRQKFESLGCGYHNGIYYSGTKLFRDGKSYTAIITSDKKIYIKLENNNQIRNNFGLNYKDNFFDEGIDNIFSRDAIQKWCYENTDKITLKSVHDKLVKLFEKYIYFEDKRKYSLLACYRIAGFFMPIWRARARLFIFAEMGSSKSRLSLMLHNTGFNSIALGDWTLAYLQRLIESTRGETHIDDFETLDEEKKKATTRLVKTGFMKGYKAGKISEGKSRIPETYDLFNTTTLNNTEGLNFISTDRCITTRIPKISKKEYDKEPNFEDKIWKELRDELYILGLKFPELVRETYDKINSDKIRGRLFFIIKPELTIAKLISNKLYEDLENFWIEEIKQRDPIDYETDWEFNALKQICKILSTLSTTSTLSTHSTLSTTGYFVLLDEVVKPIGLELYNEEEFNKKKRSMSIVIGNCLRRSPIFKRRQVKGKTQYKVDFKEFRSLLEAKGFLKPILDILGVDKVECVDSVGGEMGIRQEKIK